MYLQLGDSGRVAERNALLSENSSSVAERTIRAHSSNMLHARHFTVAITASAVFCSADYVNNQEGLDNMARGMATLDRSTS